jgi:hypothetical protein
VFPYLIFLIYLVFRGRSIFLLSVFYHGQNFASSLADIFSSLLSCFVELKIIVNAVFINLSVLIDSNDGVY